LSGTAWFNVPILKFTFCFYLGLPGILTLSDEARAFTMIQSCIDVSDENMASFLRPCPREEKSLPTEIRIDIGFQYVKFRYYVNDEYR
jgi:hypothetical protein